MLSGGTNRNGAPILALPTSDRSPPESRKAVAPRSWQKPAFRRAGRATAVGGLKLPSVATLLASPTVVPQRAAQLRLAMILPAFVVRPNPPTRADSCSRNRATPDSAAPDRHTAFPSRAAAPP